MLELKNITKSFGDTPVLNGISLTLDKGRIMSILGPSGGGKTTLLNIILGITDATGGQILFDGEDLTRVPMEKRGFNIVFQDYALFPNLNAYENITYGLRNNPGVSSEQEIKERHPGEHHRASGQRLRARLHPAPARGQAQQHLLAVLRGPRRRPRRPRPPRTGARRRLRGVIHHVGRIHPGGQAAAQHRPRDHQP